MPRDKAARYRSKESKEGIINAWLSLKNWIKPVFRAIVASKTFSIGTILDEFSRNQTLHYIWGQQAKLTQKIQQSHFFLKSFDMAKSNTTSLLRLHSAVCSQLSGKDWQKKKKKILKTSSLGNHSLSLACAQVQHQLFMRLSVPDEEAG